MRRVDKMKTLYLILIAAFLAAPCMAMTNNQSAYLQGFEDGWNLLYLRFTDIPAYNAEVAKFNASLTANLNESEAAPRMLPLAGDYMPELPEVFR